MTVRPISPSDTGASVNGSFSRQVIKGGKCQVGLWRGYATVKAGVSYASLNILIPAQQKGVTDTASLVIDANSRIQSVSMRPLGALTLGTSTGKLKFAATLTAATAALYVESAAASSGVLAVAAAVETINGPLGTTVGSSDVTYKIFATDGVAAGSAAASTVTASVDTKILVEIGFWIPATFPTELEVGKAAPAVI